MSSRQHFDTVVVGAGIVGTSIAFRLTERGQRVAVVEANTPASGTSSRSFAWFNSEQKQPEPYHRLNAAGMAEYGVLARDVPGVEVHRTGALRWPETPDDDEVLEQRRARLTSLGHAARWITRGEAEELEPQLRLPAAAERVLLYEDDGWVDPPQVIRALLDAAGDAITLVEGAPVEAIDLSDGAVATVHARGLTIDADSLVVAAGTGTPAVADLLGARVPVRRSPGLIVVTSPVPPGTLGRIVLPGRSDIRPDISGGIRISAVSSAVATPDEGGSTEDPDAVLARTVPLLPVLESTRVARALIGVRPIPEDDVTIAGRIPGVSNAWVAVTHSGVTLGPLLGRLIASEVTGAHPDELLRDFRPDRFVSGAGRRD